MQFGRFHGIALIGLGLILLFTQVWLSYRPGQMPDPATLENPVKQDRPTPVAGVIGLIVAGVGVLVLLKPDRGERAVK